MILLKNNLGAFKKRSKTQAIIEYPNVKHSEPERYLESLLRLYLPHVTYEIKPSAVESYVEYVQSGEILVGGEKELVSSVCQENKKKYEFIEEDL